MRTVKLKFLIVCMVVSWLGGLAVSPVAGQPIGACCLPDGGCINTTPEECDRLGGLCWDPDISCAGTVEACCLPDGTCIDSDLECCPWCFGGQPQGPGTKCEDIDCPGDEPKPELVVVSVHLTHDESHHNWMGAPMDATEEPVPVQLQVLDPCNVIGMVNFYYSLDGYRWVQFYADNDGTEPEEDTEGSSTGEGDGWTGYFDREQIPPPDDPIPVFFRAEAYTPLGIVSAENMCMYDPTPPSSVNLNVEDWQVVEGDVLTVDVDPILADIAYIIAYLVEKPEEYKKGIPGISQQPHSRTHCAPTAAAACLKYFENQSDPNICGGLNDFDLVEALAKLAGTNQGHSGTYPSDLANALRNWINNHGGGYTVRGPLSFNWKNVRDELERSQDVLVGLYWDTDGGHRMTMNSIVNRPLDNGKIKVDFMDPWTGQIQYGELDPGTGHLDNFDSTSGNSGTLGNIIIVCPKEDDPNGDAPGGSPSEPGPDPGPIDIPIPHPGLWILHTIVVDNSNHAYRLIRIVDHPGLAALDFGDAPERPYPTTLAVNGARHVVPPVITPPCLGNSVDTEPDGQPNATATGDDNAGIDDEDGVTFITTPLIPGQPATVDVTANAGGFLYAWVDFNGDGSWAQPGDQIFNGVNIAAGNNPLTFWVPFSATPNITTYSRFRFTTLATIPGLSYDGLARDGEVEDYKVSIKENPKIKWLQLPDLEPNGIDIRVDNGRWLADDFECTSYGPITDVHFWGSWKYDEVGEITRIHLSFHSDDPVGPGGSDPCNLYSQPDKLLWQRDFYTGEFDMIRAFSLNAPEYWWDPATGELIPKGDSNIWRIDIDIPIAEAFIQDGSPDNPTIYWLDVQVDTYRGEFGWKTRRWPEHYMDDAVWDRGSELPRQWKELRYPKGHPYHGLEKDSIDMAFVITGEKEPQPKPPVKHLKWSQPPIEINPIWRTPVYCGWDELSLSMQPFDTEPRFWQVVADDFRCLGNMPVTSVHWWGSYEFWEGSEPPLRTPDAWRIGFWSNVPADPTVDPPFSHPRLLLWQIEVDADRVHEEPVGFDQFPERPPDTCFQYYVQLEREEYFWQEDYINSTEGSVFWISIVAVYHGPVPITFYPWGWKTRPWHWMDDAVTFNLEGELKPGMPPGENLAPVEDALICGQLESFDVAFELDTDPNWIKWEQPFTGIRDWRHYDDELSMATVEIVVEPGRKWLQPPDLSPTGIDVDATVDLEPGGDLLPQILADDFPCTTTGPVTDIHIWGSWYNDYLPGEDPRNVMFTLSIHADIPVSQSSTGYSMPGELLWRREFQAGDFFVEPIPSFVPEAYYNPCVERYEPDNHQMVWKYSFYIDSADAFYQRGSPDNRVVYWLSVQAQPSFGFAAPVRFGWKTSVEQWNDDAVWAVAMMPPYQWQELRRPETNESLDLAFEITTEQEHEELIIHSLVADDWRCDTNTPVTAAVWWGSYLGYNYAACQCLDIIAPPVKPDYFMLTIWDDVPAGADTEVPYSHPNNIIWEYKAYDYDEVLVGYDKYCSQPDHQPVPGCEPVFRYSVRLPKEHWFRQKDVNDIYWFSVVAVYDESQDFNYFWGWTNHKHVFNDDAVVGYEDLSGTEPAWQWEELYDQTGLSEDMSFMLFTWPWPPCWGSLTQCHGDVDGDGWVKASDFLALKASWYKCYPHPAYNPCADFDRDGCVKASDFLILKAYWYLSPPADGPRGGKWPP